MTTLHLESGLTGSLVTINMVDEGVVGERNGFGLRGERALLFKNRVSHLYGYILGKDTCARFGN